jgi:hypothetical protein
MVDEVLDLLVQITDDQWWSRAWIFQEDYLARTRMWLLIRHTQGLDKSHKLKHLSGKLVVKSEMFRKYTTLFCLALYQKTDQRHFVRNTCQKILRRACKYIFLNKYRGGECDILGTVTVKVMKDLTERATLVPSDIFAITANVCGYDIGTLATNNRTLKIDLGQRSSPYIYPMSK